MEHKVIRQIAQNLQNFSNIPLPSDQNEKFCESLPVGHYFVHNFMIDKSVFPRVTRTGRFRMLGCPVQLNSTASEAFRSYNNAAIKDLKAWVNSIDDPKNLSNVLEMQIHRALSSLDIYLETEGTLINSSEFQATKTYLKAFRDRTHSRPYKLIENSGSVVYTQI